ncbi:globin 1 [Neodiprion pinetum]|uniref:globin 1 n=1 Tax=Neodiprion pinetum TaxID=441929 RepID=UPI001EDEF7CE|nr:hemoglobin-2 [Neodiprion pinetum]XP_046486025.1 hemoglobin-2 [Neodiprion pinetum]XP_046622118.1 hemoglobin-2 [Neodiprion virginianus]XP_046622119.1 hemoglobin-2 [Neodiprion virginianus]
MGGLLSSYWGYSGDDELDPASGLTGKQKRLVTETWGIMRQDPMKLGIAVMMRLFTKHPDYRSQFHAFKDTPHEDLPKNKRFQAHASAIANALSTIIDSLKDPGLLEAILISLGEKHHKRGQTVEQFNNLKLVLLVVFKEFLGSRWTPEVNNAWSKALDFVYSIIFKVYA